MKSKILTIFCVICLVTASAQMLKTPKGPNIYINPDVIKKSGIRALSFVEYTISGKNKTISDKYDLVFDTSGRPVSRLGYAPPAFSEKITAANSIFDTIVYDENKNLVIVKSNKNFEHYFKYDAQSRAIYSFVKNTGSAGTHFSVSNYAYDKYSRIISSKTKEGSNSSDTTKIDIRFDCSYIYDEQKLLKVIERKFRLTGSGKENKEYETVYFFEYKNGLISRISAKTNLGEIEIAVSGKEIAR